MAVYSSAGRVACRALSTNGMSCGFVLNVIAFLIRNLASQLPLLPAFQHNVCDKVDNG